MTTTADKPALMPWAQRTGRDVARARFPARLVHGDWQATAQTRDEVWERLASPPFVEANAHTPKIRLRGLAFLLDWLETQPGRTWQERWLASGADRAGAAWREIPARWLREHGQTAEWRLGALTSALLMAISADLVRPALGWLVTKPTGPGSLVRHLARARDPDGFAMLRALCDADPHVSSVANSHTQYRAAEILAAKGGLLADVAVGDVLELLGVELDMLAGTSGDAAVFYRILRAAGVFGPDTPPTLRQVRGTVGQRTPEDLIDRYDLACQSVRDLLVTIYASASRRSTTPAWKASRATWACGSGGIWRFTTQASTACACRRMSRPPGNSGCAPNARPSNRTPGRRSPLTSPG